MLFGKRLEEMEERRLVKMMVEKLGGRNTMVGGV